MGAYCCCSKFVVNHWTRGRRKVPRVGHFDARGGRTCSNGMHMGKAHSVFSPLNPRFSTSIDQILLYTSTKVEVDACGGLR